MREFGKKDVRTYTDTPHSWAANRLGWTFWEVLKSKKERVESFAKGLSLFDAIHPVTGVYPFEDKHQAGNSPDRTFAVDVGGGRGHAMVALRKGYPTLQGKMVLQDRQEVLDAIGPNDLPGVEKMQHNFFAPQPVKGAQVYYIRRVFHDWLDNEARQILANIVPAMAPDSRILISDMALPEPVTAKDTHAVWLDLMMLTIGGKERTKRDWETLVESAGLKLVKLWQTPETKPLVVVECALPDAPIMNGTAPVHSPTANGTATVELLAENGTAAVDPSAEYGLAVVDAPAENGTVPMDEPTENGAATTNAPSENRTINGTLKVHELTDGVAEVKLNEHANGTE
jgi:O-methyltransferase domain